MTDLIGFRNEGFRARALDVAADIILWEEAEQNRSIGKQEQKASFRRGDKRMRQTAVDKRQGRNQPKSGPEETLSTESADAA